jgi:hypothetical protein|uniref:DUF3018 family protein n=1 Tax=Rhodopseudomonas palustris (strain BisA53) TaxID=316055 RepID=Q07HE1_RHOP5
MDKPVDKAAKSSKATKPRSAGAERVRRHREKMKALGLKPVTLWLPDVNSPEFKAQIARDIAAINASADEKAILEELTHIEIDDWK